MNFTRIPHKTFSIAQTPLLTGKTAFVTGGNSGLGLETVKAIAARGAHVFLATRNQKKGVAAADAVKEAFPAASIEVITLDLGSSASIKLAANKFADTHEKLDILVNNAGLMAVPLGQTEDGFETQFGVNYLGHWSLTSLLMPQILKAPSARIITVTSLAHHFCSGIDFDDPHLRKKYSPWGAYTQSKLANYYFAIGLHREFQNSGSAAKSLLSHPGLSQTNLQQETAKQGAAGSSGKFLMHLTASLGMSAAVGALPQVRAALDPKAKSGQFYVPKFGNVGAPITRPFFRSGSAKAIEKLWKLSEQETGLKIFI